MLYKYLSLKYAELFVQKGQILFRSMLYFLACEDARRGPEGDVCESSSHSGRARAPALAAARRASGTAQRPPLRDRRDAPRASARASQYPETSARARLRLQSRAADAAADGRGHTAEPPGPRGGCLRRADRSPGRVLGASESLLGPEAPRSLGCVLWQSGDTSTRAHDPQSTNSPFYHGLLDRVSEHVDPTHSIRYTGRTRERAQQGRAKEAT